MMAQSDPNFAYYSYGTIVMGHLQTKCSLELLSCLIKLTDVKTTTAGHRATEKKEKMVSKKTSFFLQPFLIFLCFVFLILR